MQYSCYIGVRWCHNCVFKHDAHVTRFVWEPEQHDIARKHSAVQRRPRRDTRQRASVSDGGTNDSAAGLQQAVLMVVSWRLVRV